MSLEAIYEGVLNGDAKKTEAEVTAALGANTPPEDILYKACIPAMEEVGRLFEAGEKFVPEMLISARAMQEGLKVLTPLLVAADVKPVGKVVMGTVKGDLHDIGKNLVAMMLEGAGFEVIDLGINVPAERFVQAVRELEPDAVGLSAFLTTTALEFGTTIDAIRDAGLRDRVKILIGGAPVDQALVDRVGADGFAPDASSAVRVTKSVLGLS